MPCLMMSWKCILLLVTMATLLVGCAKQSELPAVMVTNRVLAPVDHRIFGQFLERASWGESGPEAFVDHETGRLPDELVALMKPMRIGLLRFPGGSDVDYIDWRDLISHAPSRKQADRPVTIGHTGGKISNRFGLDEFLTLCNQLDAEPLLVVKMLAAVTGQESLDDVAHQAAAMVAYCNAPLDANLPGNLADYPAARAKNGRRAPHNVRLWQVGNELWMIQATIQKNETLGLTSDEKVAARYIEVLTTIIDAMKAVDPSITILTDGPNRPNSPLSIVASEPAIRRRVDIYTDHAYAPGEMQRDQSPGPDANGWGDEDYWKIWTAMPGEFSADGQNVARRSRYDAFAKRGKRAGVTEWNWNGWGERRLTPEPDFDPLWAAGLGAAGFVHGMLRNAEHVTLANQSMLLGHRWGITAIRADPDGDTPPGYLPQGLAMLLHARNHGQSLLVSETRNIETYSQPRKLGWSDPPGTVAFLDVLATGDADGTVYLHVINRSWDRDLPLRVELSGFDRPITSCRRFGWQATPSEKTPIVRDVKNITDGEAVEFDPADPVCAWYGSGFRGWPTSSRCMW